MIRLAAAGAALAAGAAVAMFWGGRAAEGRPPESPEQIARGAMLYAEHCAACHGAELEGEPDWREPGPDGLAKAPPHDASGHTWHHGDALLFRITAEGPAAVIGGGYRSAMPGFGDALEDDDIWAVLAFIRSTWPERQRAYQAEMTAREGG